MAGGSRANRFRYLSPRPTSFPKKSVRSWNGIEGGASLLNIKPTDKYGLWSMEAHEAAGVAEFLAVRHVDRSDGSPTQTNRTRRPYARRPSPRRARLHEERGSSSLQVLRCSRPYRELGPVRVLLAVRQVRKEHADAEGVRGMRNQRAAGRRGKSAQKRAELLPRLQLMRRFRETMDGRIICDGGDHAAAGQPFDKAGRCSAPAQTHNAGVSVHPPHRTSSVIPRPIPPRRRFLSVHTSGTPAAYQE